MAVKEEYVYVFKIIFTVAIIALLLYLIIYNCIVKENFTAPGLTLTRPPNWFPQNAAKPYRKSEWKVKTYLDRYPFYNSRTGKYKSIKESNELASTDRFWVI